MALLKCSLTLVAGLETVFLTKISSTNKSKKQLENLFRLPKKEEDKKRQRQSNSKMQKTRLAT
jgi:hypothetical protein